MCEVCFEICRICRYSTLVQTTNSLATGSPKLLEIAQMTSTLLSVISFAIPWSWSWIGWCPPTRLTEKGNRLEGFNTRFSNFTVHMITWDLVKGGTCDSAFLTSFKWQVSQLLKVLVNFLKEREVCVLTDKSHCAPLFQAIPQFLQSVPLLECSGVLLGSPREPVQDTP